MECMVCSRLQKVGIWAWDDLCWLSFFSRFFGFEDSHIPVLEGLLDAVRVMFAVVPRYPNVDVSFEWLGPDIRKYVREVNIICGSARKNRGLVR